LTTAYGWAPMTTPQAPAKNKNTTILIIAVVAGLVIVASVAFILGAVLNKDKQADTQKVETVASAKPTTTETKPAFNIYESFDALLSGKIGPAKVHSFHITYNPHGTYSVHGTYYYRSDDDMMSFRGYFNPDTNIISLTETNPEGEYTGEMNGSLTIANGEATFSGTFVNLRSYNSYKIKLSGSVTQ